MRCILSLGLSRHLAAGALLALAAAGLSACSSKPPRPAASAAYVGNDKCVACHAEQAKLLKATVHGNAGSVASKESIRGDFKARNVYVHRGVTSRMWTQDGKYFMRTQGADGVDHDYPVDLTMGWRHVQIYLTRFPDGGYQLLPTYYDLDANVWFDQTEGIVPSGGRALTAKDNLHWTNRGRTWNAGCAGCHGSQVEKRFNSETATYDTRWEDLTINCEACHGPGSIHAEAWTRAGSDGKVDPNDDGMVDLKALTPAEKVEECAECHAAKSIITHGYRPGERFLDYYQPLVPSTGQQFFADGRNKGLNYTYIEFIQGECFRKGNLACTGCHDPHGSGNVADLREPEESMNRLCTSCHPDMKTGLAEHTHHEPESRGSQCIECHMPLVDILGRLSSRDHMMSVPVPAATKALGTPNACNSCHRDRDPDWAIDAVKRWFNDDQQDRVNLAAVFLFGYQKDPAAPAALMGLFTKKDSLSSPRRAAIPSILASYQDETLLAPLVPVMLDDKEDPLVRDQIALALAAVPGPVTDQALLKAVQKPDRAMRRVAGVELARRGVQPKDPAIQRAIEDVIGEFEAIVRDVRADVPEEHALLGDIYRARKAVDKAESEYRIALKLDPEQPQVSVQLGTLLAARGDIAGAAQQFSTAASLLPTSPVPPFNLGVLYQQAKRSGEAIPYFSRALEIDPGHAEALYYLALARLDTGEPRAAVELLTRFVSAHPRNAMAHYQLGRAYEASGDRSAARDAYDRAIAIAPNLGQARAALENLGS